MSKNEDMDKTLLDIDGELDRTLDATVADGIEVGATIKATIVQDDSQTGVTLVDNSDNSQTYTIQKQELTYQQETVFDDAGVTISDPEIEKTVFDPAGGKTVIEQTVAVDKTIVDSSAQKTVNMDGTEAETVEAGAEDSIAATTLDGGKTIAETSGDKETVAQKTSDDSTGKSRSAAMKNSVGGTVSFSGGSISVNVRPRNVASTLSSSTASDEAVNGLEGKGFSDFELLDKLGEGGMGVVYSARQSSIDRSIALKMIKSNVVSEEAKSKFLVEAVVTGDLDHPNIVPVHDLGVDSTGNIFYAMKQVAGDEWSKVIGEKSRSENIEILLRVCDAIAFAHDRGVIHRDLKPENVMLGAFGEVLVMDWGLALAVSDKAKAEAVGPHTGIAGTPAYLAPEMARTGAWKMLGACSDIYLLGAILFEIVAGKRAHTGKNVRECLKNAAKNIIVETEHRGELIDIAYKAMATNPADRYASVKEFQKAIRDYMSHSESIVLSDMAEEDLKDAEKSGEYDDYAKALFGFRQAVELWEENTEASAGVIRAGVAYAHAALRKGDLDLGLSLVTEAVEFDSVRNELEAAKEERLRHRRRLKILTRGIAALGVIVVVISLIAALWIHHERKVAIEQREEAIKQEKIAVQQRKEAQRQEKIAVEQRSEAVRQEKIAIEQREEAVRQGKIAVEQREEANKQRKIAEEKQLLAQAESKRANEQATIAEEQRKEAQKQEKIALAQREEAVRQEKIAIEQREEAQRQEEIAQKARVVAEEEKNKAQKSEERALAAIEKMVTAQTQQQLEKARREAAELTAKETQAELSSRDELKENNWWVFDKDVATQMQQDAGGKYGLPVDKTLDIDNLNIDFKLIPPGIFGMGSRVDEPGRSSEEYLHRVEISRPFYMAETELALSDWNALTGEIAKGEGDYPVWNVSYTDIKENLLPIVQSKLPEGWRVRMPTEAEWEWAARAGTNTPYYSGSTKSDLLDIGHTGAELLTSAKERGRLEPNAWGLYDMIGNLAEWCEDMYVRDGYLSDEKVQVDPLVTEGGKHYVVRGGAWSNLPEHCRAGYRSYANKDSQYNFLGVRLVLLPPLD